MNFAVFSDDPCRVSYVESIAIPLGQTQVQLYGIKPGARNQKANPAPLSQSGCRRQGATDRGGTQETGSVEEYEAWSENLEIRGTAGVATRESLDQNRPDCVNRR